MQSEMEGTLFFEPLHQESFMLELQSLIKYALSLSADLPFLSLDINIATFLVS